jgi:nucleoside-triphosphatase THEP1
MRNGLSEKWIKASIAGTIWAASEIVLGSFLHNLRIPFSGNILTAIGLVILISVSYIWNEKGLFWRAGLICAIMKTMSPSAVIFGPMIAIFAESVLLELSVLILGRNAIGYIAGSMLAMSWNLLQKILSYIIYYGSDIIEVYANLLRMAQRQLNIQTDIVWLPVFIMLAAYALFGILAAVIGIKVGKKMLAEPDVIPETGQSKSVTEIFRKAGNEFNYSVVWLGANILLIISSFFVLSFTPWYFWIPVITGVVMIWSLRYKRAMRQISKPRFWIFFVIITLLASLVFTEAGEGNFWQRGLLTGIQMNFRAAVIITGFTTIGTELYNPDVRSFFQRTSFRNLPLAIELSVESLPAFIATIPDLKSLFKDPVSIFHRVLSHAGSRLNEMKSKRSLTFILTGGRDQGKTTFLKKIIAILKENQIPVMGFFSEKIMDERQTTGYDIVNIETGKKSHFMTIYGNPDFEKTGKFCINPEGLNTGRMILRSAQTKGRSLVVIDEVGMLELRNSGWTEEIAILAGSYPLLLVVRDEYVKDVIEKWKLDNPAIIDINEAHHTRAASLITERVSFSPIGNHNLN